MKTHSCKAKGRRLQKEICERLLFAFPQLAESDIQWTSMGAPGIDIKLSEAAKQIIPLAIEAKNVEANKLIYDWYHQAEYNSKDCIPCVVMHKNHEEILAVLSLSDLITLLKR